MIATMILSFLLALTGLVHAALKQTEVVFVIDNTASMAARKDQLMSAIDDFQKSKIHLLDSRFGLVSFYSENKRGRHGFRPRSGCSAEVVTPISFAFRDLKREVRDMKFVKSSNMGVKDFFGAVVKSLDSSMNWSKDSEKFIYVITDAPFGFDALQNPFQSSQRSNDGDESYNCEEERYYSEEQFGKIWHKRTGFNLIVVQLQEKYVNVYAKMLDRLHIGAEVKYLTPNNPVQPAQNVVQFLLRTPLFSDYVDKYFKFLRSARMPNPLHVTREVLRTHGFNYSPSKVIQLVNSLIDVDQINVTDVLNMNAPSNIKALDINKFEIMEDPMTFEYYIAAFKLMSVFRVYKNLSSPFHIVKGYYLTSHAYREAFEIFFPNDNSIEHVYRFIRNLETPQLLNLFLISYNKCLSRIYLNKVYNFKKFPEMLERYTSMYYPDLSEAEKVSFKASVIDYFVEKIDDYQICDMNTVKDFFSKRFKEAALRFSYKQLALFRIRKHLLSEKTNFDWTSNLHEDDVKPLVEKYLRESRMILNKHPYMYEMSKNPLYDEAIRDLGEAKGIKDFECKIALTTFSDGAVQMYADSSLSEKNQRIINYVLESLIGKAVFPSSVHVDVEFFESLVKSMVIRPYFQRFMMFMPDLQFSTVYLMSSQQQPADKFGDSRLIQIKRYPVKLIDYKRFIQIKDEGEEFDYHGFNPEGAINDSNMKQTYFVESDDVFFDAQKSTIGDIVNQWQTRNENTIPPAPKEADVDSRGDVPETSPPEDTVSPQNIISSRSIVLPQDNVPSQSIPTETVVTKGITVFSSPSEEVQVVKEQNGEKINLVFKKNETTKEKVESREIDDDFDENSFEEMFEVEDLSDEKNTDENPGYEIDDVYDGRSLKNQDPSKGKVVYSNVLTVHSKPEEEEHRIIEQNGQLINLVVKKQVIVPTPVEHSVESLPRDETAKQQDETKPVLVPVELSKANAVEPPKADKVEPPKADKVEPPKADKVEPPKADKVEPPKADKVEQPKADKVEPPKADKVEPPKADKVEPPKADKVEQPKADKVEQPKVDIVEPPKADIVEPPKADKKDSTTINGVTTVSKGITVLSSPDEEVQVVKEQKGQKINLVFKKRETKKSDAEARQLDDEDDENSFAEKFEVEDLSGEKDIDENAGYEIDDVYDGRSLNIQNQDLPKSKVVYSNVLTVHSNPEEEEIKTIIQNGRKTDIIVKKKPSIPTPVESSVESLPRDEIQSTVELPKADVVEQPETSEIDPRESDAAEQLASDPIEKIEEKYEQDFEISSPGAVQIDIVPSETSTEVEENKNGKRKTGDNSETIVTQTEQPSQSPVVEDKKATPSFKPKEKVSAETTSTTSEPEEEVSNNTAVISTAAAAGVLGLMGGAYTLVKKLWMKPAETGQEELYDVSGEEGVMELDQAVQINESNYI